VTSVGKSQHFIVNKLTQEDLLIKILVLQKSLNLLFPPSVELLRKILYKLSMFRISENPEKKTESM